MSRGLSFPLSLSHPHTFIDPSSMLINWIIIICKWNIFLGIPKELSKTCYNCDFNRTKIWKLYKGEYYLNLIKFQGCCHKLSAVMNYIVSCVQCWLWSSSCQRRHTYGHWPPVILKANLVSAGHVFFAIAARMVENF